MCTRAATLTALLLSALPAPAHAEPADDTARRIREQTVALEAVVESYNELREDLRVTTAQTGVLSRQIEPLREQMAQRRASVGRLAAAGFRSHRTSPVNVLLDSRSTRDVIDRMLLLQTFAQQKQREINELALTSDRYDAARRTLDALIVQQREQQRQLSAQRQKIEKSIAQLERDRRLTRTRAGARTAIGTRVTSSETKFVPPVAKGAIGEVLSFALKQLGKGYKWAGEGPGGFDCSGLVSAAFRTVGVVLPHNARKQRQSVQKIGRGELEPGDLIFFYADLHHVGIYIGDDKMVHAPNQGEQIRVDLIDALPINSFGRAAKQPVPAR